MKRRLLIKGRKVQDIGYRMFLLSLASEHDLSGFQVRNIGKNAVESFYEGNDDAVKAFESDVKELAPEGAEVEEIEFEDYDGPVKDIEKFRTYFTTLQLGKMIEIGVKMLQKQDEMVQKQDKMLQKQETMLEKQDKMIQKQDETLKEIKGMRKDFRSFLEERITKLEEDVNRIKEKLGIEVT